VQLLRFESRDGGAELAVIGPTGVVSLPRGFAQLRRRGRMGGLPERLCEEAGRDGRTLLACLPALRGAIECLLELDDGAAVAAGSLEDLRILPFVAAPELVLGVSYNYHGLARQEGIEEASTPVVFTKAPSSVAGAYDDVHVPRGMTNVDFEAEVGVVIGAVTYRADVAGARRCIAGYTAFNDLTSKLLPRPKLDLETITVRLKAVDGFAPIGAVIVTPDEIGDLSSTSVICRVNGEQRQCYPATDWVHDPAEVVSFVSSFATLQPGDLITMGTSQGIGIAEIPPRLLRDGDVVEVELSGYPGTRNTMRMSSEP
jgi:acylpyruvate hydrolase